MLVQPKNTTQAPGQPTGILFLHFSGISIFPCFTPVRPKQSPCNVEVNKNQISGILPKIVNVKSNEFFLHRSLGLQVQAEFSPTLVFTLT